MARKPFDQQIRSSAGIKPTPTLSAQDNPISGQTGPSARSTPKNSLPTTPDETQTEEIEREITVLINGKSFQIVDADGDVHFANKDNGHGLSVQKNGDVIVVSGPGGTGNACGGRMLINAKGGQWYKGGGVYIEATASQDGSNAAGGDSTKVAKDGSTTTTTTAGKNDGVACSQMFYGDHIEECHGNVKIRARNITIEAVDVLTLQAGNEVKIQAGPKGGGNLSLKSGQITTDTDTQTEKVSANKVIDGIAETVQIGYDPRSSKNTVGWMNVNETIGGDYKINVSGVMHTIVSGTAPPSNVISGLISAADRADAYKITVALGALKLSTLKGSALFSFGVDKPFPTSLNELKPGSVSIKALSGIAVSSGLDVPKTSLPAAGDVAIFANTKINLDATTDINVKAKKEVKIESTTGDISIISTAGKIYLN